MPVYWRKYTSSQNSPNLPKSYYSYTVEEGDNMVVSSKKWKLCLNKGIREDYNFLQIKCKPVATQTKRV